MHGWGAGDGWASKPTPTSSTVTSCVVWMSCPNEQGDVRTSLKGGHQAGPGAPDRTYTRPACRHTARGGGPWWVKPSLPWGRGPCGRPFPAALRPGTFSRHTHVDPGFISGSTQPCASNLLEEKSTCLFMGEEALSSCVLRKNHLDH